MKLHFSFLGMIKMGVGICIGWILTMNILQIVMWLLSRLLHSSGGGGPV